MLGSEQPLLSALAVDIATAQAKRGSQTVGNRFREQLQDLISRLDECASKALASEALLLWLACCTASWILGKHN